MTHRIEKELSLCQFLLCLDLVRFLVSSHIKPRAPLLVALFRQCLKVSAVRPNSPGITKTLISQTTPHHTTPQHTPHTHTPTPHTHTTTTTTPHHHHTTPHHHHNTTQHNTTQHNTTQHNTPQHTTTHHHHTPHPLLFHSSLPSHIFAGFAGVAKNPPVRRNTQKPRLQNSVQNLTKTKDKAKI